MAWAKGGVRLFIKNRAERGHGGWMSFAHPGAAGARMNEASNNATLEELLEEIDRDLHRQLLIFGVVFVIIFGGFINSMVEGRFVMGFPYGWHEANFESSLDDTYTCPECGWSGRPGLMNMNEYHYFCPECGKEIKVDTSKSLNDGYWGWFWENRPTGVA